MNKMLLIGALTLVAIPALSQGQAKRKAPRAQSAVSTGYGDTVIAHVADGGGWQTTITLMNLRPTATTFSINCYGDNGGPQRFSWADIGVYSSVYGSLDGSGSVEVMTMGTASATSVGWCDVTSPGSGPNPSTQPQNDVAAFAVFSYGPTGQEVSVPAAPWLLTNALDSLILAYDNTNGYSYGVALVDSTIGTYFGQPNDTVYVRIKDEFGNLIATDLFHMAPQSHLSFVLADWYPAIADTRGTVTFSISTSSGDPTLAGLGIRAAPSLSFSSVGMIEPATY